MRKSLLDILACPIDKFYPLELFEINTFSDPNVNEMIIKEGVLYCSKCSRFYPITDEIPIMLPDELREKEKDMNFLQTWRHQIPDKILKYGNPWHL
ncbi:MAG TPA: Trm112 family protein [Nitrososphaeraceae archaeon]